MLILPWNKILCYQADVAVLICSHSQFCSFKMCYVAQHTNPKWMPLVLQVLEQKPKNWAKWNFDLLRSVSWLLIQQNWEESWQNFGPGQPILMADSRISVMSWDVIVSRHSRYHLASPDHALSLAWHTTGIHVWHTRPSFQCLKIMQNSCWLSLGTKTIPYLHGMWTLAPEWKSHPWPWPLLLLEHF